MKKYLLVLPFLCLMASPAWAFPDNGVLDTFTGVDDTSPPNANWTNEQLRSAGAGCDLEDNAVAPGTTGGIWGCYWNTTSFNADQEVYATIINIGSTATGEVCGRLANIGSGTTDGYCVEWADGTSTITIYRVDNEVGTSLTPAVTQAITTTDKIGLKMVGDQICLWFSDSGGAWAELTCRTDATYSAGGFIGLQLNGSETVGAMDDFGGGNVTAAAILQSPPIPPVVFQ